MEPRDENPKARTAMMPEFLQRNQKGIFLFLLLCLNIFIFLPYHDFQPFLAQGDHGRDLYAFEKTLEGALPYRDYWWEYGPWMPYYYAMFYKIFGIGIQSALGGHLILIILLNLLFYMTLSVMSGPWVAFVAALWFSVFNPKFAHTYNHIGGLCALTGMILTTLLYSQNTKRIHVYWGLSLALILSLIKLNIGLSNLAAFVLAVFLIERSRKKPSSFKDMKIILSLALFFIAVFLTYWALHRGLPPHVLRLSLPQLTPYYFRTIFIAGPLLEFAQYTHRVFTQSWVNMLLGIIAVCSAAETFHQLSSKKNKDSGKYTLFILILCLFTAVNLHEFLASGVIYRILWFFPPLLLLVFLLVTVATNRIPFWARNILLISVIILCTQAITIRYRNISSAKIPSQFLAFDRAGIYVQNPASWIKTVSETTRYLMDHLGTNEKFFALPADPLYYFLTGRDSPVRQLVFGEYLPIPPEEEKNIINTLEKESINYILVSSAENSTERGTGVFGKTYCPLLGQYIFSNFTEVARFGDWESEPTWVENHGTKILKRKF